MARLKRGWSDRAKDRSLSDIGGAISFNIWQIGGQGVLDLENEGFETHTHSQRMDVIIEFAAYLLQSVDRLIFDLLDGEERAELITAEADVAGDYTGDFLKLLNQRIAEYSTCRFDVKEGPSFVFLRLLGDHVTDSMGERDSKWITGYIIDVVGHQMFSSLKRILPGILDPARKTATIDPMREKNYD